MKKVLSFALSFIEGLLISAPYMFVLTITDDYTKIGNSILEKSFYVLIIVWLIWRVVKSLTSSAGLLEFILSSNYTTFFLSLGITVNWRHDVWLSALYIIISIMCGVAAFWLRRLELHLRKPA